MPSYEQLPAILNGFFSVEQRHSRSRWSIDEGARPLSLDDGLLTRMRASMTRIGYPEGATGVLTPTPEGAEPRPYWMKGQ